MSGVVTVTAAGTRTPLRRARVTIQGGGLSAAVLTTDTDTEGKFRIDAVPPGTYRVVVAKPGFVAFGPEPVLDVAPGQGATVAVAMQRGGAIEGRLVDSSGDPIAGLTVSAVRLGFGPYGKKIIAARQATTDDLGRFRLYSLPAGDYYIQAAPDPLRLLSTRNVTAGAPQPVRTYYSGASIAGSADLSEARTISVESGQDVTSIDFGVATAVPGSLRARVALSTGDKPEKFGLRVQRVGSPAGEVSCVIVPVLNDSSFTCPNMPRGDFWILVTARAAPDAQPEFAATRVAITGGEVPDMTIATAPGVAIRGRVETADNSPLPAGLELAALETEYEFPSALGGAGSSATPPVPVGADGGFVFPSLAGTRILRTVRLPETWALASVRVSDTDIADLPVKFADNVPSIRVVITPRTGAVSGTVQLADAQPASGTRVVVFSEDARRWGARSRFIRTAEVQRDGHYTVRGLLPGAYLVAFVDRLDDGAWEDPDVLARLRPAATAITAADKQTATVDWKYR